MQHTKLFLLFCLVILGSYNFLGAQSCTISSNTQNFCTQCASNISSDGVISGNVTVTASAFTLPINCPETGEISIGALTLNLGKSAGVVVPDELMIDPSAATTFQLNFVGANGSATFTFRGTIFNRNQFPEAQAAVRAEGRAAPISLLSWSAEVKGRDIHLSWASEAEIDNEFYSVEHSTDGQNFAELVRRQGAAESAQLLEYDYVHRAPARGNHYYRLAQQDFDGTRTTFDVLNARIEGDFESATVFPNPALPGQRIELTDLATESTIGLYDVDGRKVTQYPAPDRNERVYLTLPTDLAAGVYLLKTASATRRLVIK